MFDESIREKEQTASKPVAGYALYCCGSSIDCIGLINVAHIVHWLMGFRPIGVTVF